MALYDIEVRDHDGQLLDSDCNLAYGDAMDVLTEMENDYPNDQVYLIKRS
jgi:hypothetical protein